MLNMRKHSFNNGECEKKFLKNYWAQKNNFRKICRHGKNLYSTANPSGKILNIQKRFTMNFCT